MLNPYTREKIESWVSDFCDSARYAALPPVAKEYAEAVLVRFLVHASESQDRDPGDVSEKDLRAGLLEGVAKVKLPEASRPEIPRLCQSFLEELGEQGRLGGGANLGRYVAALRPAYLEAAADRPRPIVAATSKVGRNDPCPCGSGQKYKKCCLGLLDRE